MITQPFRLTLYSLLISLLFFSCKKENKNLESLQLTVEVVDGKYICNWTKSNISTFEHYQVYYSIEPFDEAALTIDFDEDVVFFDQEVTTWDFVVDDFAPILYFQLGVKIEGRTIRSNIVEVFNNEIHSIEINLDEVFHYPEKNALYFSERNTDRLIYYDYATSEIIKERAIGFDITASAVGNNGFGEELYLIEEGNTLTVLDANTLEEKARKEFNRTLYAVETNGEGAIFLTVQQMSSSLHVYKRDGLIFQEAHDANNYAESRGLAFLSQSDNLHQLIEVGNSNPFLFNFQNNGDLVSLVYGSNPFSTSSSNTIITVSPEGNYFVKSRNGVVFNSSLEKVFDARSFSNKIYNSFAFDENETYLYAAIDASSTLGFKFHRFSIPNFEVEEKAINNYDPIFLYNYDGKIMVVAKINGTNTVNVFPLVF